MKTLTKVLRIILVVASVGTLALFFFMPFASVTAGGKAVSLTGSVMCFKGTVNGSKMAVSADVWFCFMLSLFTAIFSAITFSKHQGVRWAALITSLASSIYMLVINLSKPVKFVDIRPLKDVTNISYAPGILVAMILMFVTFALVVAYIFALDKVEVMESKGAKLPLIKRFVNFLKDYKGEIKKVVWPGPRDVVKNTLIVLAICVLFGIIIWAVDFGLGALVGALWGAKA